MQKTICIFNVVQIIRYNSVTLQKPTSGGKFGRAALNWRNLGKPRYDNVAVFVDAKITWYAKLELLFACKSDGVMHEFALVRWYDTGKTGRQDTTDCLRLRLLDDYDVLPAAQVLDVVEIIKARFEYLGQPLYHLNKWSLAW